MGHLSDAEKDRFDHIMAIYAACVAHMDTAVGRLVAALKQRSVLDNTLILFLSDNGGNAESGPRGRLEGASPGGVGSTVFCGQSWATLENTPFRRYKHYNHEGGISTPLIAHWPAGIAGRGEFRQQPGHLVDIMATCVDLAGAKYPAEFHGQAIQPMEGRSLAPAFGNQPIQRDALYWEHEGNAAIRVGDWKLVRLGRNGPWELYNLKTDRTELHDLAAAEPARAADLTAKWEAWAEPGKRQTLSPARRQQEEGQEREEETISPRCLALQVMSAMTYSHRARMRFGAKRLECEVFPRLWVLLESGGIRARYTYLVMVEHRALRMSCFPSPLPSPSGRGRTIVRQGLKPKRLGFPKAWLCGSLSLRERAGVRGNGPPESRQRTPAGVEIWVKSRGIPRTPDTSRYRNLRPLVGHGAYVRTYLA